MKRKQVFKIIGLLAIMGLASCAHQPSPEYAEHAPGIFLGLFHGFTAPITLVLGWLWEGRIYAFPNTGWTYDLGFLAGCFVGFFGWLMALFT